MTSRHDLAPEFNSLPNVTMPASRLLLRGINLLIGWDQKRFRPSADVKFETHSVPSSSGHAAKVFEIAPADLEGPAPGLLCYHGGGFFFTYASGHLAAAQRYAVEGRCRVFFPDYRLSIDHPFPAGFDDCYATLSWVHSQAEALGVERKQIAVIGDSAGGAMAAGVAQKALDREENPLCGQVLIYPVTDHQTKTASALEFTDTPAWRTASNRNMWKIYLDGSTSAPPYAAPLHRDDFSGLPPARVELAELDPLRDEGRLYAEALEAAGVPVELYEMARAPHGYDMAEGSDLVEANFAARIQTLRRFFGTA